MQELAQHQCNFLQQQRKNCNHCKKRPVTGLIQLSRKPRASHWSCTNNTPKNVPAVTLSYLRSLRSICLYRIINILYKMINRPAREVKIVRHVCTTNQTLIRTPCNLANIKLKSSRAFINYGIAVTATE